MYYWSMSLKFTLDSWLISSCLTIYIPSYHKRYNFMVNLSGSYSFNVMLTNSYFVLFKMFLTEFLHVTLLFAAFGSLLFSAVEGKNKDFGPSVKDAILTGLRQLKEMVKADSFYICFSSFPTILTLSSICFFLYYYVKSITLWNQFTT